jgi:hypothetical protein
MLESIKSAMPSMPVASAVGLGLFLGKKALMGTCCKTVALFANNAAEWDRLGNNYLTLAKKDFADDLKITAIAGLGLAVGIAATRSEESTYDYVIRVAQQIHEKIPAPLFYVADFCTLLGLCSSIYKDHKTSLSIISGAMYLANRYPLPI